MQKIINPEKGIYILEILADKSFALKNKQFASYTFPKGFYYYVGSAQKNLRHRLLRHFNKTKLTHWHIDYLTTIPSIEIIDSLVFEGAPKDFECVLVNGLNKKYGLEFPVKNFGNSDCRKCYSHLLFANQTIKIKQRDFEFPFYHFLL